MKLYKGFNKDLKCRDFQFEVGKTYEEKTASLCNSGFHACENPIDCLGYYAPGISVYHEVILEGVTDEKHNDSKRVGTKITIGAKLKFLDMINATFEYAKGNCTNNEVGGDMSALNGGDRSALQGGNRSALNGGNYSAIQGGDRSVVYGGENSKVKGGLRSVLAIQYWKNNAFIKISFAEVDGKTIKADTWYTLDASGEFTEVAE